MSLIQSHHMQSTRHGPEFLSACVIFNAPLPVFVCFPGLSSCSSVLHFLITSCVFKPVFSPHFFLVHLFSSMFLRSCVCLFPVPIMFYWFILCFFVSTFVLLPMNYPRFWCQTYWLPFVLDFGNPLDSWWDMSIGWPHMSTNWLHQR